MNRKRFESVKDRWLNALEMRDSARARVKQIAHELASIQDRVRVLEGDMRDAERSEVEFASEAQSILAECE